MSVSTASAPTVPQRIVITLQVAQVDIKVAPGTASATNGAADINTVLTKAGGGEATQISLQTANDFPGVAEYSHVFALPVQDQGKPNISFVTLPSTLQATPHINADGTITVILQTQTTEIAPGGTGVFPSTTVHSMTTTRTFQNGKALSIGGLLLAPMPVSTLNTGQGTKEFVQYVTVTVFPAEKAARP